MLIALALAAAEPVTLPQGAALTEAVRARDAEFFALMFEGCDPARLRTMLSPDFEMYHDRDGLVARTANSFVADYARLCVERQAPDAWRSRRELVGASLNVHPIPGHGAIEDGEHLFYERRGEGPSASSAAPASLNCGGWPGTVAARPRVQLRAPRRNSRTPKVPLASAAALSLT